MPGKRVTSKQLEKGAMAVLEALARPLTDTELAEAMGTSRSTAKRMRATIEGVVSEHGQFKREEYQTQLLAVRTYALASLTQPEVWAFASLRDRAVTFGILDDKTRLELGQATSHIHHLHEITTREQFARRLKDLGILDMVDGHPSGDGHDEGGK